MLRSGNTSRRLDPVLSKAIDRAIRERAGHRCEYCHLPQAASTVRLSIDHIVARQHNGADAFDNLAAACPTCNRHKGPNLSGIDPATDRLVRLYNPRRDPWSEHFAWAGVTLGGLTDVGRATVVVLAMNLPEQIELRELLAGIGDFPFA